MLNGAHVLLYVKDADKARAFFRDTLRLRHVDAGEGWLIFALPPAEMGIHPVMDGDGEMHELYLMCDDIKKTVAELRAQGVEVTQPIADRGWGLVSALRVPGGGEIGFYQPRHPTAAKLAPPARAPKPPTAKKKASPKRGAKKAAARAAPKRSSVARR
jgi:catechol 2,3-dioxygenase-like lactoylglutathione lyase family enzyme